MDVLDVEHVPSAAICSHGSVLLVWSQKHGCVQCAVLNQSNQPSITDAVPAKLTLTASLKLEGCERLGANGLVQMMLSRKGECLVLWDCDRVVVINVPTTLYKHTASTTHKTYNQTCMTVFGSGCVQMSWLPHSKQNILAVLDSQSTVRLYQVNGQTINVLSSHTFPVDGAQPQSTSPLSSAQGKRYGIRDTAVGFAFGESVRVQGTDLCTLFVVSNTADVYFTLVDLTQKRYFLSTGALSMSGECSMYMDNIHSVQVCILHAPLPVLILLTNQATLHHFLLIPQHSDDAEHMSFSLHLKETLKLPASKAIQAGTADLRIMPDRMNRSRYLVQCGSEQVLVMDVVWALSRLTPSAHNTAIQRLPLHTSTLSQTQSTALTLLRPWPYTAHTQLLVLHTHHALVMMIRPVLEHDTDQHIQAQSPVTNTNTLLNRARSHPEQVDEAQRCMTSAVRQLRASLTRTHIDSDSLQHITELCAHVHQTFHTLITIRLQQRQQNVQNNKNLLRELSEKEANIRDRLQTQTDTVTNCINRHNTLSQRLAVVSNMVSGQCGNTVPVADTQLAVAYDQLRQSSGSLALAVHKLSAVLTECTNMQRMAAPTTTHNNTPLHITMLNHNEKQLQSLRSQIERLGVRQS